MDPIALDIRLIREVLGAELRVAPGRGLMARVLKTDGLGRGSLSIAGAVIEAKLPKDVQAGQDLRLVVRDVSPERVVLSISDQAAALAGLTQPAAELPGGGTVRVSERPDSEGRGAAGGGSGRHTLALIYDAPALGAVDLRFELDPQSLRVSAELGAGEPVERAQDRSGELQQALTEALGRPVTVDIKARREPLDVYA